MEFKTYPKIHAVGKEEVKGLFADKDDVIVIQEKIDGGNFRFYFTEKGGIIFGSRTQQLTSNEGDDSNVAKGFRAVIDYIRKQISESSVKDTLQSFGGLIFFGEACFKHTITYDYDRMPRFIGYDVLDTHSGQFLVLDDVYKKFELLHLEVAPVVKICKANEITSIDDSIVPVQKYALSSAPDKLAEGVVFKNYSKQLFGKYVRNVFKEKNAEAFGGQPKYNKVDDTNNAEFLFKYVTNPRIEKIVLKMIDEGAKLDMSLMGQLIKRTYTDVIEEEWREILLSNWKLDFKKCRQLIAPRCRSVLNSMITNNAL